MPSKSCFLAIVLLAISAAACNTTTDDGLLGDGIDMPAPDGIDPRNPNIERIRSAIDLNGVKTIRIELPTARVNLAQSGDGTDGSIQITKIINKEGLSNDVLADLLQRSEIFAERSFVDETRLDVEATVPEDLADTDVVFDIRLVVPVSTNVEVVLGNGPVEIADMTGNIEVRTANGAVAIDGVTGNVIAETTNRAVSITDTTGNVKATTTDGDITLRLAPAADGEVAAETTTGAIRITLAKESAASLDLQSPGGTVSANLGGFSVTDVTTGEGYLKGVLNGGGGTVEAMSDSGEITFVGM